MKQLNDLNIITCYICLAFIVKNFYFYVFQEMDTLSCVKDETVTSTVVKPNVTPILQPFTSSEEKSAPFFDVSSNLFLLMIQLNI